MIFKTVDHVPPAAKQTHVRYHTIWLNNFKFAGIHFYQAEYPYVQTTRLLGLAY